MNIILGPPGTGKTQSLLNVVDQALEEGIKPEKIAFLAFTKKAATEAKERARIKFGVPENKLIYFRTIHSLVFRQLGLTKTQVMQRDHYQEFGKALGISVTGYVDMSEGSVIYGMDTGDRLIFLDGLARTKQSPLRQVWEECGYESVSWFELERVASALVKFKHARGLYDFTDMLEMFCKHGHVPSTDLLIIDEAQDLSTLQWAVIERLIRQSNSVFVAGDDDQSIFSWSGANTVYFINLLGKVKNLTISYRVPERIQSQALSIVRGISTRRKKSWKSHSSGGEVQWHNDIDTVPLDKGNWLILTRNGYMLKSVEEHCMLNGFSFDGRFSPLKSPTLTVIRLWEQLRRGEDITFDQARKVLAYMTQKINLQYLATYDRIDMKTLEVIAHVKNTRKIWHEALDKISPYEREYFIAARRAGETLVKTPRLKLSTIHGAKGGEADNVLLFTDLAPKTYDEFLLRPDDEHRVFYVGVTRAKQALHLIQPKTNKAFLL